VFCFVLETSFVYLWGEYVLHNNTFDITQILTSRTCQVCV